MAVLPTLEEGGKMKENYSINKKIVEKEADYNNKCVCDLLAPMTRSL